MIRAFIGHKPLLGVCLGHQALGHALGGRVVRAGRLMHGKHSLIDHDGTGLYAGCPQPMQVARYHSLVVLEDGLPAALRVTSVTADRGEVMGLQHRDHPVFGVQFHPESVLTPEGPSLLANFLEVQA
jgi:anthranilate synthase/aminodeoxychorismate synthase-like glutamine amidotransferase